MPTLGLRRLACAHRVSPEPTYADVHPTGGVWAAAPTCRSRGLRFEGLTRMFKGLRANDTPRQTPLCPKRSGLVWFCGPGVLRVVGCYWWCCAHWRAYWLGESQPSALWGCSSL